MLNLNIGLNLALGVTYFYLAYIAYNYLRKGFRMSRTLENHIWKFWGIYVFLMGITSVSSAFLSRPEILTKAHLDVPTWAIITLSAKVGNLILMWILIRWFHRNFFR